MGNLLHVHRHHNMGEYARIFRMCKNIISTHKSVQDSNWGAEGQMYPAGLHYGMFNKRIVRYPNNKEIKDPGMMEEIFNFQGINWKSWRWLQRNDEMPRRVQK